MDIEFDPSLQEFEVRLADAHEGDFVLVLFVAGASDLSVRAIAHVRALCERHLEGHFALSVVDVHRNPGQAHLHNVLATPTLVKERPLPARRLIGDLSHTNAVLAALGISSRAQTQEVVAHEPRG